MKNYSQSEAARRRAEPPRTATPEAAATSAPTPESGFLREPGGVDRSTGRNERSTPADHRHARSRTTRRRRHAQRMSRRPDRRCSNEKPLHSSARSNVLMKWGRLAAAAADRGLSRGARGAALRPFVNCLASSAPGEPSDAPLAMLWSCPDLATARCSGQRRPHRLEEASGRRSPRDRGDRSRLRRARRGASLEQCWCAVSATLGRVLVWPRSALAWETPAHGLTASSFEINRWGWAPVIFPSWEPRGGGWGGPSTAPGSGIWRGSLSAWKSGGHWWSPTCFWAL